MFVKILGILDLVITFVLFLMALEVEMPFLLLLIIIIFLAAKSMPFILNFGWAPIIDFLVALLILINFFFSMPSLLFLIAALAIGQKGVMSLL